MGRAGQLLNNMISAMGLKREQVYIANIVKCRPPGNRTPERDECDTCSPFLMRQIRVVRPKVIVALGATAAKNLLGDERFHGVAAWAVLRLLAAAICRRYRTSLSIDEAGGDVPSGVLAARSAAEGRDVEGPADGDEVPGPEAAGEGKTEGS